VEEEDTVEAATWGAAIMRATTTRATRGAKAAKLSICIIRHCKPLERLRATAHRYSNA